MTADVRALPPEPTPAVVAALTWACGIAALRTMAAEWTRIAESCEFEGLEDRRRQALQAAHWLRRIAELAEQQRPPEPGEAGPVAQVMRSLVEPMAHADCEVHFAAIKRLRAEEQTSSGDECAPQP